jgi:hypothetical protein
MKPVYIGTLAKFSVMPLRSGPDGESGENNKAVQKIMDFRNHCIEAEKNNAVAYLDKILVDDLSF